MVQSPPQIQLRAPVSVRRIIRILTDPYFLSFSIPVCLTGTAYGVWKLYWRRKGTIQNMRPAAVGCYFNHHSLVLVTDDSVCIEVTYSLTLNIDCSNLAPRRILDQHTVQYFKLIEKSTVSHNTAM